MGPQGRKHQVTQNSATANHYKQPNMKTDDNQLVGHRGKNVAMYNRKDSVVLRSSVMPKTQNVFTNRRGSAHEEDKKVVEADADEEVAEAGEDEVIY